MDGLEHIGVLGMKWGRRKSERQTVVSIGGKPAIITGTNFRNRSINRNPTHEEIRTVQRRRNPVSTTLRNVTTKAILAIKDRVNNSHISKEDFDKANTILNNTKSKKEDIDWALKLSGVDPNTGKSLFNYKSSDKHFVDFIQSVKNNDYNKSVSDLTTGVGKLAMEAAVGFAIGYGLAAVTNELLK